MEHFLRSVLLTGKGAVLVERDNMDRLGRFGPPRPGPCVPPPDQQRDPVSVHGHRRPGRHSPGRSAVHAVQGAPGPRDGRIARCRGTGPRSVRHWRPPTSARGTSTAAPRATSSTAARTTPAPGASMRRPRRPATKPSGRMEDRMRKEGRRSSGGARRLLPGPDREQCAGERSSAASGRSAFRRSPESTTSPRPSCTISEPRHLQQHRPDAAPVRRNARTVGGPPRNRDQQHPLARGHPLPET